RAGGLGAGTRALPGGGGTRGTVGPGGSGEEGTGPAVVVGCGRGSGAWLAVWASSVITSRLCSTTSSQGAEIRRQAARRNNRLDCPHSSIRGRHSRRCAASACNRIISSLAACPCYDPDDFCGRC